MKEMGDLIKECPYCKTLWMKEFGCPLVKCGWKEATKDYIPSGNNLAYNFTI
jgi:hypothetical protein